MTEPIGSNAFPIDPPIKPMLAKRADRIPKKGTFLFEPKWDGFRALVFRGDSNVFIQSRDEKPLDRYFPELHETCLELLPKGCVVDGEILIRTNEGLDFDALQLRLHPAQSRVDKLAAETPASFVAFDVLAVNGRDCMADSQQERRALLEDILSGVRPPLFITPVTSDHDTAELWFHRFEGAGLDGVIVKPVDLPYKPGKRSMIKVKHVRTADCVVAGFRWYKNSKDAVGSLLLGLYDEAGVLHYVGAASSLKMDRRRELAKNLAPLRVEATEDHPWGGEPDAEDQRTPGGQSRWSAGKDRSWEPLRVERVCEVKYDHLQGKRFRHAPRFLHWRPDKQPSECVYDQLEEVRSFDLEEVFTSGAGAS